MANTTKKKLQSLRTREAILAAATRCFGKSGYPGCGLDAIAQTAGITKGAIYTHFASKAELFIAIIEYAYKRTGDRANALKNRLTFTDAIIELLYECVRSDDFPIDHKLWAEILAVASREPEVRKVFLRCQAELKKIIENWMSEGMQIGEIKPDIDIKSVSEMLFVLGNGLVMRLSDEPGPCYNEYFKVFEITIRNILQP